MMCVFVFIEVVFKRNNGNFGSPLVLGTWVGARIDEREKK